MHAGLRPEKYPLDRGCFGHFSGRNLGDATTNATTTNKFLLMPGKRDIWRGLPSSVQHVLRVFKKNCRCCFAADLVGYVFAFQPIYWPKSLSNDLGDSVGK
jgi:hypothetical protein